MEPQDIPVHVCIHCGNVYTQKSDMDAHVLLNHCKEKVYECMICKVQCDTLLAVRSHMDIHITVNAYNCTLCGDYFKNQTIANEHTLNVHGNGGDFVAELSANVSKNHESDDIVIDLKTKNRFQGRIKTEEKESNDERDPEPTVDYINNDQANHLFSAVENDESKMTVLLIKGKTSQNLDTVVYENNDSGIKDEKPQKLGVVVFQSDGSININTVDENNSDLTEVGSLPVEQDVADTTNVNILDGEKENREMNNTELDIDIDFDNFDKSKDNADIKLCDEADKDNELRDVSDNLEIHSEFGEFFRNDSPKDQLLCLTNDTAPDQTSKSIRGMLKKDPAVVRNSKLTCELCHKTMSCASVFKAHLLIHEGVKPHSCSTCGKSFRKKNHLKEHEEIHKGDTRKRDFECTVCQKRFFQAKILKSHMVTHDTNCKAKPFKCNVCQKTFRRNYHLKEHSVIHNKHRPVLHTCNICKAEFILDRSYTRHMVRHQTGYPHKCALCNVSYNTKSKLIAHEKRLHDNTKPYLCNICHRSYNRRDSLKDHLLTHDKNRERFPCSVCDRTYSRYEFLRDHLKLHENGKLFHCESCNKSWQKKASLNQHIKSHHPDQVQKAELEREETEQECKEAQLRETEEGHQDKKVEHIGKEVVKRKLASVTKEGIKIELHFNGTKVSKAQPLVNGPENENESDSRKHHLKSQSSGKRDDEMQNENENDSSTEETFEQKQFGPIYSTLEKNVLEQEISKENISSSEIGRLMASGVMDNVVRYDAQLNPINLEDKNVNTTITCREQNSRQLKGRKRRKKEHEKSLVCDICGSKLGSAQAQVRHMKYLHGERKQFMCEICGASYSWPGHLQKHKLREHPETEKETQTEIHVLALENVLEY